MQSLQTLFRIILLAFLIGATGCFAQTIPKPTNPAVYFKASYIKDVLQRATAWQLAHPNHSPTDWTNGAFYAAFLPPTKLPNRP